MSEKEEKIEFSEFASRVRSSRFFSRYLENETGWFLSSFLFYLKVHIGFDLILQQ